VDSTLVVWTVARGRVEMSRTPVNPDSLRSAIRVVGSPVLLNSAADAERRYLYRLLIGPAERRLRAGRDEIVFVDDPGLGSIPYAALLNGAEVPVVENHPVWTAVSVAAAAQPAASGPPQSVAVLAPEFNTELNPALDPLPAAKAEGDSVSRFYGPRVIQVAGTPEGFLNALKHAEVVHFAGHAVTDPLRPQRSYLVLSSTPNNAAGHLRASAIDSVQAGHVRLVVLSACTTLGAATNGLTGLSGALLDRGAGGVIGSLWRVDDDATRALMVAFHQHYAQSRNPQRALWEAQRAMYARGSKPAVWAAFRYMGR
jgi:CHAT domain-containing protein